MSKELPIDNELINWRRDVLLQRNRRKYSLMTLALRFAPQGLKLGYYLGRWVDDVVDGDEPTPYGFTSIDSWLDSLTPTDGRPDYDCSASFMLQEAIDQLEPLADKSLGDNVQNEFSAFIEAMRWEYNRRTLGLVLSETEINQSYWEGFSHAQNITLIALKAKTRIPAHCPTVNQLLELSPAEMPLALPIILGKAYAVKDLGKDLGKGIFNMPLPVIRDSGLTTESLIAQPTLARTSSAINNWANSELAISHQLTVKLRQKKLDLPTKALVGFLTYNL